MAICCSIATLSPACSSSRTAQCVAMLSPSYLRTPVIRLLKPFEAAKKSSVRPPLAEHAHPKGAALVAGMSFKTFSSSKSSGLIFQSPPMMK
eukprot:9496617-Pyramimonas_sp.AAC.1